MYLYDLIGLEMRDVVMMTLFFSLLLLVFTFSDWVFARLVQEMQALFVAFLGEWVLFFVVDYYILRSFTSLQFSLLAGQGFHHIDLLFFKDENMFGITVHRVVWNFVDVFCFLGGIFR